MLKKSLQQNVAIFIVTCFISSLMYMPAYGSVQEMSSQNQELINFFKIAMAVQNKHIELNQDERLMFKEYALSLLEAEFAKIKVSGITEADLQAVQAFMPKRLYNAASSILAVSNKDIDTEQKILDIEASSLSTCIPLIVTYLVGQAINSIGNGLNSRGPIYWIASIAGVAVFIPSVICVLNNL